MLLLFREHRRDVRRKAAHYTGYITTGVGGVPYHGTMGTMVPPLGVPRPCPVAGVPATGATSVPRRPETALWAQGRLFPRVRAGNNVPSGTLLLHVRQF